MKYSVLLIVTVIVVGISLSDAVPAGKNDPAAAKKNDAAKKKAPEPEPEEELEEETPEEEEEQPAEEEEGEEEEGEVAPPKAKNAKGKKGKAGAPAKRKPAKAEPEEEEEEEDEDDDTMLTKAKNAKGKKGKAGAPAKRKPAKAEPEEEEEDEDTTLTDLKNMAASMNPLNLIDALKNTPAKKLKNAVPELKNLTQILRGTPMGSYFQNLASILSNSTPQIWNLLFEVFPTYLTTLTETTAQLIALGAMTVGRLGKSAVELADIIFGGAKDVLSIGNLIPGVNLLTAPLSQVVDVTHGITVGTADLAVDELKAQAKRASKLAERQMKRTSSGRLAGGLGGSGGLLGGL